MTWAGHPRTSTASWKKLRPQILRRDGGRCHICGGSGADVVDHKVPYSLGGTDHPDNLAAACDPCHRRKTSAEGAAARRKKYNRKRPVERHPGLIDPPKAS